MGIITCRPTGKSGLSAASPQRVWQTLGITGVEKLHTHLGDGIFENSHAGRTDLISETVPDFDFNTYTLVIPGVTAGNQLTVVGRDDRCHRRQRAQTFREWSMRSRCSRPRVRIS